MRQHPGEVINTAAGRLNKPNPLIKTSKIPDENIYTKLPMCSGKV
jgi:hypothetical protein